MTLFARLRSFAAALVVGRRLEREMDEEWRFHLDARTDAIVAQGLSREAAERQARREFGDPRRWKEDAREARGLRLLQDAAADLRYAARALRQARAFTITTVATLTLGVGLNVGVFSVLNGTLLRPWPLPDPDEVVLVFKESGPGRWTRGALALGAGAGLVVPALAAPVLRAYLLGLGPYDPIAYLAAVVVLVTAIGLASVAPIRRAVSIDPVVALRQE